MAKITPANLSFILVLAALPSQALPAGNPPQPKSEAAQLFDHDGYRIDRFLAPVPETVPGAKTLTTEALRSLIQNDDPALIDVLPAPIRPNDLPPDTLWMPPPHETIAGAVWLPNVGYGHLSDDQSHYLEDNLARLTGAAKTKPLVFFCKPNCWMSWNAAKRASSAGYSAVYWYPDGVAGWRSAGQPTASVAPLPMRPSQHQAR